MNTETHQDAVSPSLKGHTTNLTKKKIDLFLQQPLPVGQKQVEITDEQVKQLKLIISKAGSAAFHARFHHNHHHQSEFLGDVATMTVGIARQKASAYYLSVVTGEDHVSEKDRNITVKEACLRYESHSKATKKSHKTDSSKIHKYLIPHFGRMKLGNMKEEGVQAYLKSLDRQGLKLSTQDRHIALLQAIECYAIEQRWITSSFMGSIKMNNPKNGRTRILSEEELGRFHVACRRQEGDVYRAFEFIASLGLRISEALNARLENWDSASNTLYLEDSKTGPRFVTLNPSATAILEQQAQKYSHDGLVFRGRNNDRPMSYPAKAWKRVLVDADLNDGTVTPHCLRHTHCSHLLMHGVDEFTVAKLMGLSSTHCIHRHYGHLSNQALTTANAVVTDVINQSVEKVQNNEAA